MFFWRLNLCLTVAATAACVPFVGYAHITELAMLAVIMCCFYLLFTAASFGYLAAVGATIPMDREYDKPNDFYYGTFQQAYSYLLRLGGARIHVTGLEKVPTDAPFLFVSNHISKFDNMVQSVSLRNNRIAFITKQENYSIPIGRHFMKRACYLPIDRGNPRSGLLTINRAAEMIASNTCCIGVFPEGTRGDGRQLLDLKPGCLKIACKSKCPIVVGTIRGTEKIHKRFPFRRTDVYFDIVDVIPGEIAAETKTVELADRIAAMMKASLKEGE